MTLTIEISPEVEAELSRAAQSRALDMAAVAAQVVVDWTEQEKQKKRSQKLAAIASLHGMCAGDGRTVDDFLADRHAEGEAEYDKWVAGQKNNRSGETI